MKIAKLLGFSSAETKNQTSGLCWPAIGVGYATAIGAFLGFDLAQTYILTLGPFGVHILLMAAANLGAILGAYVAILMVRRRSTESKLCRHAYFVWLAVTLTLMVQVALTTGLNPQDSPSLMTAENIHQH